MVEMMDTVKSKSIATSLFVCDMHLRDGHRESADGPRKHGVLTVCVWRVEPRAVVVEVSDRPAVSARVVVVGRVMVGVLQSPHIQSASQGETPVYDSCCRTKADANVL